MTTYTAIPNSDIDPDSPITTSLMTLLRDNPIAITEGAAGAPSIQNAALATDSVRVAQIQAGAVHTSELNTSTANTSTTSTITNHFTMTGGSYVFAPQFRGNSGTTGVYGYGGYSATNSANVYLYGLTSYTTRMTMATGGAGTAYCQWRYVAASPPHDMGDGDIPAFIYAIVDNATGELESISSAEEPVWLANGPTNAYPDIWRTVDGKRKKFKIAKEIPAEFAALSEIERAIEIAKLPDIEVEITEAMVHADMDLIPHPWAGNDLSGKTAIMLDPVSDTVRELSKLEKAGEDIHDIMRKGYIKIGNTPLNRVTPQGLLIPSTNWRQSL